MNKYTKIIYTLVSTFNINICLGQSIINSTGITINNNNFIFEYSIGEISIETLSTTSNNKINYLTQGLLQPSIKIVNPVCEIINDTLQFFPNPAQDKIRIVGRYNWITSFLIYDASGRLMANSLFYNNSIDITRLAAGMYIIVLFPGCDNKYKTLKILKQ